MSGIQTLSSKALIVRSHQSMCEAPSERAPSLPCVHGEGFMAPITTRRCLTTLGDSADRFSGPASCDESVGQHVALSRGFEARIIRVGIVDDHIIVRTALKHFLCQQEDLAVVGEAGTGREAIELVRAVRMHVLILDLFMPDQTGMDALRIIRAKAPALGVLILSGYPEAQYAAKLIRKGARGYLSKDCPPGQILDAVRSIGHGHRYISPTVAEVLSREVAGSGVRAPHSQLTDREFQVFLRLAKGQSSADVANGLSLSLKSISTHRLRVLRKMGASTNSEVTYYALKHNLIE